MNDTVDDAGEELLSLPVQAAFATSMAIFFLVDILGNSLVILAIITNPKLQSTSNLYLFALAVTDISIGESSLLVHKRVNLRQISLCSIFRQLHSNY